MTTKKFQEDQVNELLTELNKRLGVIISLTLRMVPKEAKGLNLKEQVKILSDLGIRPRDMADILGRTPTHINKELSGLRNPKKKDKKSNEEQTI